MNVQRTQAIGNQGRGSQNFGMIRGGSNTSGVNSTIVRHLEKLRFPVTVKSSGDRVTVTKGLKSTVTLSGAQLTNPSLGVQALRTALGA